LKADGGEPPAVFSPAVSVLVPAPLATFSNAISRKGEAMVLLPGFSVRWRHLRACMGKYKGKLDRNQPRKPDPRNW
jgi:hypothetical protein